MSKIPLDQMTQFHVLSLLFPGTVNSNISVVDDGTSIEEILKMAEKLGTGDTELDCMVILKFLEMNLTKRKYKIQERRCFVKE